ncbi:MAG: hypothetical protein A3E78_09225 [Alphaproteobacteria bacterium RIFCSPHIGHO2_12_FULL_63_12]|nr:MAG: hypothetical protein A3E78_09225 [Alphaproteobacteria bacterium RIFCSPHIGHO2_12_FULL_63_12]
MIEMKCARPECGEPEYRIDGYCSTYCRDIHEVEKERDAWKARAEGAEAVYEEDVSAEREAKQKIVGAVLAAAKCSFCSGRGSTFSGAVCGFCEGTCWHTHSHPFVKIVGAWKEATK